MICRDIQKNGSLKEANKCFSTISQIRREKDAGLITHGDNNIRITGTSISNSKINSFANSDSE